MKYIIIFISLFYNYLSYAQYKFKSVNFNGFEFDYVSNSRRISVKLGGISGFSPSFFSPTMLLNKNFSNAGTGGPINTYDFMIKPEDYSLEAKIGNQFTSLGLYFDFENEKAKTINRIQIGFCYQPKSMAFVYRPLVKSIADSAKIFQFQSLDYFPLGPKLAFQKDLTDLNLFKNRIRPYIGLNYWLGYILPSETFIATSFASSDRNIDYRYFKSDIYEYNRFSLIFAKMYGIEHEVGFQMGVNFSIFKNVFGNFQYQAGSVNSRVSKDRKGSVYSMAYKYSYLTAGIGWQFKYKKKEKS